jgi:Activator of Hsp90 ATPase homolog 1-like protein
MIEPRVPANQPLYPAENAGPTPLRRPPIRQAMLVRSDRDHTFDTFVRAIGVWWPVQPFSLGQARVRQVVVEQRRGGRVYETWTDGAKVDWGELLVWEPPKRFVMTWHQTPVPTEVELTFAELGPSLTRVAVEHRGWDQLTDEQLAQDCALPGGYESGAYAVGWSRILETFAAAVEGRVPTVWTPPAEGPLP